MSYRLKKKMDRSRRKKGREWEWKVILIVIHYTHLNLGRLNAE